MGFFRGLALKVVKELICQVSILCEHVVQVSQSYLPQTFLFVDISVHLLALSFDLLFYLLFIRDSCLSLFDKTISDALQLRTYWSQFIGVVLDAVLLFLIQGGFELIPKEITLDLPTFGRG